MDDLSNPLDIEDIKDKIHVKWDNIKRINGDEDEVEIIGEELL